MNSKKIILILFLTLITSSNFAQVQKRLITLKPNDTLKTEQFYISQVIDKRSNKENIGVITRGTENNIFLLNFSRHFTIHLTNTFKALLPISENKKDFTVYIHKFHISEEFNGLNKSIICEVEMEFLYRKSLRLYSLGNFKASIEKVNGLNIDKTLNKCIIQSLKKCISQFSKSDNIKTSFKGINIISNAIEINTNYSKTQYNNQQVSLKPSKKGIYIKAYDMQNNNLIDSIDFDILLLRKFPKIEHYQVSLKGYYNDVKMVLPYIFACSDGEFFYINALNYSKKPHFVQSKMNNGRYIYFEDARFVNGKYHKSYGHTMAITHSKAMKNFGIVFDTKLGLTLILNDKNMKTILAEYPTLLSEYKNSIKNLYIKSELIRKLNDRLKY